jgi:hypothetical protein
MSAAQLMHDFSNTPGSFVGLTVEQYHQMIDKGMMLLEVEAGKLLP